MSFELAFLLSSYLVTFLSLAGLALTGELSLLHLAVATVCFLAGLSGDLRGGRGFLPESIANAAMLTIFALTLFSIFVLGSLPLRELVYFLLALQAVKILAPKSGRDWLQIYLLSFFSLVAASALSVEISFAVIFLIYLFAAPWALTLFQLKTTSDAAGREPAAKNQLLTWSLFRLVQGMSVILMALTLLFFLTLPRLSVQFFGDSWASGSAVTGFSDRLALGDVAEIQKSDAAAMRVEINGPPVPERELYWRGVSLDFFDGRRWRRSHTHLVPLQRLGQTFLAKARRVNFGALIQQRITLEPTGSPSLLSLGVPLAVTGTFHSLYRDPAGNLRTAHPFPFQTTYEVTSALRDEEDEAPGHNFLQLPELDPRIAALAEQVSGAIADKREKARAMERFLKRSYGYSLEGLPAGVGDPLARFLFETRNGNCEFFATALALMLRSVDVPTRIVNGYFGGEWNPYGEYYLVRQSHAHSWVEAHFPGAGWVTLDPTPSNPIRARTPLLLSLSQFLDFLRIRWYRHVVHFTLGDQFQILSALKRPSFWYAKKLSGPGWTGPWSAPSWQESWWVAAGLLFIAAVALVRRSRRRLQVRPLDAAARLAHEASRRYRRFIAVMEKRGVKKKPGDTPDEFARKVNPEKKGLVVEWTALYQAARFSGRGDEREVLGRMDAIFTELRRR